MYQSWEVTRKSDNATDKFNVNFCQLTGKFVSFLEFPWLPECYNACMFDHNLFIARKRLLYEKRGIKLLDVNAPQGRAHSQVS